MNTNTDLGSLRAGKVSLSTRLDRENIPTLIGRRNRFGGIVLWVLALAVLAGLLSMVVFNSHLDLSYIGEYLFSPRILRGLGNTLLMALFAEVLALLLGVLIGYARLSRHSALRTFAIGYVWIFRSVPLLVQMLVWGNLALFLPRIGLGEWTVNTNTILTAFTAAVLALAFNEAAYLAEVVRSGVLAVAPGQTEASQALGLNWRQTQIRVILPQALRVMLPQAGSFFIILLKSTSLASVIAAGELLSAVSGIAAVNFRILELLSVAAIWYLAVTGLASIGQMFLERRFNRQYRQISTKGKGKIGRSRPSSTKVGDS